MEVQAVVMRAELWENCGRWSGGVYRLNRCPPTHTRTHTHKHTIVSLNFLTTSHSSARACGGGGGGGWLVS